MRHRRLGDDEDPAERQHDPAVAGRVRRPEPPLELLLEAGPQVVGQGLQGRPRAGAGDPREDGILALEHVEVGRLPGVDLAAELLERLEVDDRVVRARDGDARRVGGVRRLCGQLGADRVARLAEVAGHLEGQPAARARPVPTRAGSRSRWPGTHCSVAFETRTSTGSASPVDPVAQVGHLERHGRRGLPRRGDHLGAGVETGDVRVGPAFDEQGGQVAGPAAEVDDRGRAVGAHPRDELDERAGRARRRRSGSGPGPRCAWRADLSDRSTYILMSRFLTEG